MHCQARKSSPITAKFVGLNQALFQQTIHLHLLQLQVLGVSIVRLVGRANSSGVVDLTQRAGRSRAGTSGKEKFVISEASLSEGCGLMGQSA